MHCSHCVLSFCHNTHTHTIRDCNECMYYYLFSTYLHIRQHILQPILAIKSRCECLRQQNFNHKHICTNVKLLLQNFALQSWIYINSSLIQPKWQSTFFCRCVQIWIYSVPYSFGIDKITLLLLLLRDGLCKSVVNVTIFTVIKYLYGQMITTTRLLIQFQLTANNSMCYI